MSVAAAESHGVFSERDARDTRTTRGNAVGYGSVRSRRGGGARDGEDGGGDEATPRRETSETSTLLSHSESKRLNNSIQLFMAMFVSYVSPFPCKMLMKHLQGTSPSNQANRAADAPLPNRARAASERSVPNSSVSRNPTKPANDPGQDAQHAMCYDTGGVVHCKHFFCVSSFQICKNLVCTSTERSA